jgi:hypothetical protein
MTMPASRQPMLLLLLLLPACAGMQAARGGL